jgi:hypothetical protein
MLLALDWALAKVTGLPHLSLSWMAATHGVANALGFAFCSLLAWRRTDTAGQRGSRTQRTPVRTADRRYRPTSGSMRVT